MADGAPPNVLLVMADQLAASALPSYGNQAVRAPHLERLGEEGVVFERAYCSSPLCTPSRASMLTGQLPSRIGCYDNAADFPSEAPTLAHHLRLAGYETVLAGKMHFVGPDQLHGFERRLTGDVYPAGRDWTPDWERPLAERFAWYHDMSSVHRAGVVSTSLQLEYDAEVAFRAERELYRQAGSDRPFLLVASFTHPHDPYEVPPGVWERYDGVEIPPPAVGPLPLDRHDPHSRRLLEMCRTGAAEHDPALVQRARRAYLAAVSHVDDQVGRLLSALRETGLHRDTVVLFTSDHGDMLGERGLWYKMSFFEGSARVPLLAWAPGRLEARRVPEPVSLLDLLPTVCELAGAPLDGADPLDGTSLVPALHGGPASGLALGEYLAEGTCEPIVMVRRGPYKLVRCPGDPDQLYDLDADPNELENLAAAVETDLPAQADERWPDLAALRQTVVASQRRRRLTAEALAVGQQTPWDWDGGPGIRTGQDFWTTLEAARKPAPLPPPTG
jgi:choline-sulfatase